MIKIERDFDKLAEDWYKMLTNKIGRAETLKNRIKKFLKSHPKATIYLCDEKNLQALINCKPEELEGKSELLRGTFPKLFKKKNKKDKSLSSCF